MNDKKQARISIKNIDPKPMLQLRANGMSNKQIAEHMGVSISTVYRVIGRKSEQIKHNEAQGKPVEVPNTLNFKPEETEKTVKKPVETKTTSEKPFEGKVLDSLPKPSACYVPPVTESKPYIVDKFGMVHFNGNPRIEEKPAEDKKEPEKKPDLVRKAKITIPKIPEKPKEVYTPASEEKKEVGSLLKVLNTRVKLEGSLCNYIVDTESGSVEMLDGVMTGLLDRDSFQRFMSELKEVAKMLDVKEV